MNGSFSRGSLWFNLVTGGQTQHTSSGGTKMAGKWDYSLALPSNGEQGNFPIPAPAAQKESSSRRSLRSTFGGGRTEQRLTGSTDTAEMLPHGDLGGNEPRFPPVFTADPQFKSLPAPLTQPD